MVPVAPSMVPVVRKPDSTIHRIAIFQASKSCPLIGIARLNFSIYKLKFLFINCEAHFRNVIAFFKHFATIEKSLSGLRIQPAPGRETVNETHSTLVIHAIIYTSMTWFHCRPCVPVVDE